MADVQADSGPAPEPATPAGGQNPTAPQAAPPVDAPKTFSAEYVQDLREEAKTYRQQLRQAQDAIKELTGKAGESGELAEKLAELQAQLTAQAAAVEAAQKAAQLTRLAAKAGVDPDLAAMLDLSKIDLADEKKALEVLSKIGGGKGAQARPGIAGNGTPTDAEMRALVYGGRKPGIFGG